MRMKKQLIAMGALFGTAFYSMSTFAQHVSADASIEATASPVALEETVPVMNCLMTPWRTVDLASSVSAILQDVKVERGDRVSVGDEVAILQRDVEKAQLRLAQTRFDFAQRKLNRTKDLQKKKFVSEQEVDQLRTELQVVRMETAQAQATVNLRSIKSPIDGVVTARLLDEGELTNEQPIVTIAQLNPLRIELLLDAQQFPFIQKGMVATIYPNPPATGKYQADVIAVDQVIDAASGTFGAVLELKNEKEALPAGVSCRAILKK